jgi:hypothetical protein
MSRVLVTLCTHAAFFGLAYFHGQDRWNIIIDEIPQIDGFFSFAVPQSGSMLAEWFEATSFTEHLSIIKPRNKNQIDKLLEIDDIVINPFKDLLRKCRAPKLRSGRE